MTTGAFSAEMRADLHTVVREWYRQHGTAQDLEQAETLAIEVGRVAAECAFECGVAACGERAGYRGSRIACPCGAWARFVDYRRRWVRGVPGEVPVTRAYYHCRQCHQGSLPWDQEQGLTERVFTPHLKSWVSEVCGREVFLEARETLARLAGVTLAVSSLEEIVEEVGGRLRAAEDARVKNLFDEGTWPPADPLLREAVGKRAYLCIDAAKAHTGGSWHDIKVAAFFPAAVREATGERPWDGVGPKRYLAVQEEAENFGKRLYTFAVRLGAERAKEVVILGDGAEWIWKLARTHFTEARQILDFYHACEYVWKIAHAVFGEGAAAGIAWARTCAQRLEQAGPPGLLQSLRELRPGHRGLSATARGEVLQALHYFRRNRRRMQYAQYRAARMMIGSGPVEAACKSVVGGRLKGTGMRWSKTGADAMLAIRTEVLGQQYGTIARYARAS